ncbi:Calcium-binding component of the spindle pole body (SPB) half-bridge [Linderina macrospora]|uniref:Calcium-binding component of the spindle pole body (SPB) half-bridge n=1 Tax=Linderina macrospora TaxID=4868 RepID=A0ACC1JAW9_9FUNG|nr:Calcium-binding component of the spindle pole body (SPB) half-bridge [Linderina macrospora]
MQAVTNISDDQLAEIHEAFSLFDTNKDGLIDFFELKVAMRALGFNQKKQDVMKILQEYGTDDTSGHINEDNFTHVMSKMIARRDPIDEYRKAFKLIDENNQGKITVSNLKRIARELGETISEDEIQAMVEEFDLDDDGGINEEEFIKIMMSGQ